MFCPRCKMKNRAGTRRCSNCGAALVAQPPKDRPKPTESRRSAAAEHEELVVLRTYPTVIDAELAKTALESVGIGSMIRSDNEGGQSPGLSFSRGVELLVRADDAQAANDVLAVEGIKGDDR